MNPALPHAVTADKSTVVEFEIILVFIAGGCRDMPSHTQLRYMNTVAGRNPASSHSAKIALIPVS